MSLKINTERRSAGVVFVRLDGHLDSVTYVELEKALAPVLASRPQALLFDMAGLSFISSMGLRVLLQTRKSVAQGGGRIVTTNLQPQIAKVFEIAAALPPENIFASIEEADHYLEVMQRRELEKQAQNPRPSHATPASTNRNRLVPHAPAPVRPPILP